MPEAFSGTALVALHLKEVKKAVAPWQPTRFWRLAIARLAAASRLSGGFGQNRGMPLQDRIRQIVSAEVRPPLAEPATPGWRLLK
ncbi:hypothetical protein [Stappia sp.]|uniref:hypothetical protein n=1 Tax=Stappia sp. TaxID=1870903 RepID=UPI0032D998F4